MSFVLWDLNRFKYYVIIKMSKNTEEWHALKVKTIMCRLKFYEINLKYVFNFIDII